MLTIGHKTMSMHKQGRGFTLIELIIVVAILTILALIAYPSYTDSLRKANRADAKAALNDAAHLMQRCNTARRSYVGCVTAHNSNENHYSITVSQETANSFVLQAAAISDIQTGDVGACQTLEINQRGERGPQAALDAGCW